jgi:hypothetical protein
VANATRRPGIDKEKEIKGKKKPRDGRSKKRKKEKKGKSSIRRKEEAFLG